MHRVTDILSTGRPIVNIGRLMPMKKTASARERTPFGQRLFEAREGAGLKQKEVQKAIGISQSTLSGLERVADSSGFTPQLADLYGADAKYLATGKSTSSAHGARHKARSVSLSSVQDVPHIKWEDILTSALPDTFYVIAPDDSMAKRIKAGKKVFFSSVETARAGDAVLIADGAGNVFIREMRERAPGDWQAHALNDAYEAMDAKQYGLRILAVLVAEDGRWT